MAPKPNLIDSVDKRVGCGGIRGSQFDPALSIYLDQSCGDNFGEHLYISIQRITMAKVALKSIDRSVREALQHGHSS